MRQLYWLAAIIIGAVFSQSGTADAVVRSQAMFASSIAEYFITDDGIRVELEIGLGDIEAFRNLLPDALYEKLGHAPKPVAQRLAEFFGQDLAIVSDGTALPGKLVSIGPRERVTRDDITGEALPQSTEDAEVVIAAELSYRFTSPHPNTLLLTPPSQFGPANVGFVVYHDTVAVNDFRYLAQGMQLDLDWNDPWYSAFRSRNMRRNYFAPMSGFLYVEPFEVRKEVIVRPKDVQRWVDIGLADATVINAAQRDLTLQRIAEFLLDKQPVTIDGETMSPTLDRANFLNRTLKSAMVVEAGQDIDMNSAVVGVIFSYPTLELPNRATMTWDMFDRKIQQVPAASVDEAGPLPSLLEPDYPVLEWQNFLQNPSIPEQIALAPPPAGISLALYKLRWWLLGLAVLVVGLWLVRRQSEIAAGAVITLLATLSAFVIGRPLAPPDDATDTLVADLLRNIYQAFDYREESDIYDALARSVSGELLTRTYLETRRGLELTSQGGARTKVKSVAVRRIDISAADRDDAFVAETTWNVVGSVGHWGHVHTRTNQYHARLLIQAMDNQWKLVGMTILQETRL